MSANDALKEKIEGNKARLVELDRERLILTTQIAAYEDALNLISDADIAEDSAPRSSRRTSANWVAALYPLIKGRGRVFSTDEILREAALHNFHPSRGNVRSQMGAYKTKGWMEGIGEGKFKVTDEGRKQLLSPDQLDDRLQWEDELGWVNAASFNMENEDEDIVLGA